VTQTENNPLVEFLTDPFAQHVPEVACGDIKLVNAIAYAGGNLVKVAVAPTTPIADPAALCIGLKGCRVNRVKRSLPISRDISVVNYDRDPLRYIANAIDIKSAVFTVEPVSDLHARVVVPVESFAKAIGNGAQNSAGWVVDRLGT
jgi:transcription termination/antitermination protein NusA